MNPAWLNTRGISQMRLFRPVLDLALLAVCTALFLYFHNPEPTPIHLSQKASRTPKKADLPASSSPLFFQASHDHEEDLWKAWADWVSTSQPVTGHCLLGPRIQAAQPVFEVLCFGTASQAASATITPAALQNLFPKRIFAHANKPVTSAPHRDPDPESQATTEDEPGYTVQGWVDTPSGRKHFHTDTQQWLPSP